MNQWRITTDKINPRCGFKSCEGLRSMNCGEDDHQTIPFRLRDDDGETYFIGRMSEYEFDPLDDFGIGYGCTELQVWENGHWTTL